VPAASCSMRSQEYPSGAGVEVAFSGSSRWWKSKADPFLAVVGSRTQPWHLHSEMAILNLCCCLLDLERSGTYCCPSGSLRSITLRHEQHRRMVRHPPSTESGDVAVAVLGDPPDGAAGRADNFRLPSRPAVRVFARRIALGLACFVVPGRVGVGRGWILAYQPRPEVARISSQRRVGSLPRRAFSESSGCIDQYEQER